MTEMEFITQFLEHNAAYALDKFETRSEITVTSKRDVNDLLTEVDLTLQKRAVEQIKEYFPGDQILAEEGEYAVLPKDRKGRCWIMDPIDGTNNFVRGLFPIFGISLAFAVGGSVVAGGVALPGKPAFLLAEQGSGATINGRRLQVSTVQKLAEAKVDFDFSGSADRSAMLDRAGDIIVKAGQLRSFGSAVASICQVATGDIDAYVHMTLSPWDFAAGQLFVEEAGGLCSRHDGSPLSVFDGRKGVVISNPAIHQEILDLLRLG
jgi:myo-inositol-1(or 4)-monophosphatase